MAGHPARSLCHCVTLSSNVALVHFDFRTFDQCIRAYGRRSERPGAHVSSGTGVSGRTRRCRPGTAENRESIGGGEGVFNGFPSCYFFFDCYKFPRFYAWYHPLAVPWRQHLSCCSPSAVDLCRCPRSSSLQATSSQQIEHWRQTLICARHQFDTRLTNCNRISLLGLRGKI